MRKVHPLIDCDEVCENCVPMEFSDYEKLEEHQKDFEALIKSQCRFQNVTKPIIERWLEEE